jgi:hypothetical protein
MNRRQFVALLGGVSAGRHRFEGTRAQPWVLPRDRLDPYLITKNATQINLRVGAEVFSVPQKRGQKRFPSSERGVAFL